MNEPVYTSMTTLLENSKLQITNCRSKPKERKERLINLKTIFCWWIFGRGTYFINLASIFEQLFLILDMLFLSTGMQVNPISTQKSIVLQHNFTVKIYSVGMCITVLYKWSHAKVLSSKMNGAIWSFKVGFFRVEK